MASSPTIHDRRILTNSEGVDTPAPLVDESILQQNIDDMAEIARGFGVKLRPHIKTHKSTVVAKRQIEAGATGIMCAKIGEAQVFADAGITDITVGYQIVGDLKIHRLLTLMEQADVTVCLDSLVAAEALSGALSSEGRTVKVLLEVNTGHDRAGVLYGQPAVDLAIGVAKLPGLQFTGVMTHEGHGSAQPAETIREVSLEAGKRLVDTAEGIRAAGIQVDTVSVGSTPCAIHTPGVEGVTEMRPGTYVYRDTMGFRYGIYGPDRCAVRYLATVSSRPARDRAILDSGAKTLAADGSAGFPGQGYVVGHPDVRLKALYEEHGVAILPETEEGMELGNRVEVIPNHVCTSVNLHDRLFVVRDGAVVDEWKVDARGTVQ
ncbi:MAG: alanine racemase [Thermomicrobiales bacterium]|nr:alanine racemase [Thermomicrobiales bacterium]